nr:nicotinate-nicotinamide nucleotide adenylyltransferase [Pseudomonas sp.]
VLGSDQLVNFCTWHEWREIVRRVRLAVAARPGSQLQPAAALTQELNVIGHPLHILPFDAIDISATAIRRKVAQGQAISGLTPPSVAAYIKTNHLYQAQ